MNPVDIGYQVYSTGRPSSSAKSSAILFSYPVPSSRDAGKVGGIGADAEVASATRGPMSLGRGRRGQQDQDAQRGP